MTSISFINRYEQFGRDWISKEGLKWQGKNLDAATETLTANVEKRAKDHIDDIGTELLKGLRVNKRIVATAGAGLIPLGKILVDAVMNHPFIVKVLIEFALHDQVDIDKLNEDLRKICKLDKVAQKVRLEVLKKTAEETFKDGLNCSAEERAHFIPIIGHIYSVSSGGYKAYSAWRKTIMKTMTMAETVHCETFVPLALPREIGSKKSLLTALAENCKRQPIVKCYRIPHCVRCFLGPNYGNRKIYCQYCTSEKLDMEIKDCKPCPWKNHGKADDLENVERLHDERWCTIRLIKAANKKKAWECIPCFLMYGKHKPKKCILDCEELCKYCDVKGHYANACGKRFFNAYSFLTTAKDVDQDIQRLITASKLLTENRTEAFSNRQRYKSRRLGMITLPRPMTREKAECILLGSEILYKNGMKGWKEMKKDEITEMIIFDYQTHVNVVRDYIKPGLLTERRVFWAVAVFVWSWWTSCSIVGMEEFMGIVKGRAYCHSSSFNIHRS